MAYYEVISYLKVCTDPPEDIVDTVSGQQGHKHILQDRTRHLGKKKKKTLAPLSLIIYYSRCEDAQVINKVRFLTCQLTFV